MSGALTEAEREAVNAAACGNCGERTAVLNLVARIKAEAVQAEQDRVIKKAQFWARTDRVGLPWLSLPSLIHLIRGES